MNAPHDGGLPPELEEIGRLVRESRRQPDPLQLDSLKRRIIGRAGRKPSPSPSAKGSLLASRLLMTLLIAFGIFLSGTGATLAIQGNTVSAGQSSGSGQYITNNDDDDDGSTNDDDDDGGKRNNDDDDDGGDPPPPDDPPSIGVSPSSGTDTPPPIDVAPATGSSSEPRVPGPAPRTAVAGERDEPQIQVARQQAEAGSDELPFTGFAAIPLLLVGVVMLASGLILRFRARD